MLATCKHKCQFRGRSVKPGETLDIAEREITDQVKSSFTFDVPPPVISEKAEETDPAGPAKNAKIPATELKRRLAERGIPFKGNASQKELEALYVQAHEPTELL